MKKDNWFAPCLEKIKNLSTIWLTKDILNWIQSSLAYTILQMPIREMPKLTKKIYNSYINQTYSQIQLINLHRLYFVLIKVFLRGDKISYFHTKNINDLNSFSKDTIPLFAEMHNMTVLNYYKLVSSVNVIVDSNFLIFDVKYIDLLIFDIEKSKESNFHVNYLNEICDYSFQFIKNYDKEISISNLEKYFKTFMFTYENHDFLRHSSTDLLIFFQKVNEIADFEKKETKHDFLMTLTSFADKIPVDEKIYNLYSGKQIVNFTQKQFLFYFVFLQTKISKENKSDNKQKTKNMISFFFSNFEQIAKALKTKQNINKMFEIVEKQLTVKNSEFILSNTQIESIESNVYSHLIKRILSKFIK